MLICIFLVGSVPLFWVMCNSVIALESDFKWFLRDQMFLNNLNISLNSTKPICRYKNTGKWLFEWYFWCFVFVAMMMMISMQSSTTEQNVPWNPLLALDAFFFSRLWKSKMKDCSERDNLSNSPALSHTLKQMLAAWKGTLLCKDVKQSDALHF